MADTPQPPRVAPAAAPATPRVSGVVRPHPARWHGRLAAHLIHVLVRLMDASLRYRLEDPTNALAVVREGPVIFALWHNRLALSLMLYQRYVQRAAPQRRMAALVSASKDGALLARTLELFGVAPVRGSTSRRGPQALLELTSWAERGFDLAITPDGPRGPRYAVQEGVIAVARLTGLPILPVSFRLQWKHQFGSWDRFQVPFPGSTCTVRVAAPLRVARDCPDAERERLRQEAEARLRAITQDT